MKERFMVVVHIDDENKWPMVLSNIENLLLDSRIKTCDIEVVANGSAIKQYQTILQPNAFQRRMESLVLQQVKFDACLNALNAHHIKQDEVVAFASVVESGVGQLVLLQSQGYVYLKP